MRFLHQIAKPEEKERKEFERERSIPEEEIYEFSNFVKRIRPYSGEYVSYTVERSGVSIHEVIEELKKVVKNKKGVKKVSIAGEPSYILRSFVDFDVGREFPASIEMWCASSDFCTTETDLPFSIPAKRAMKMNKDQIEMSLPFLPKECHVDDVHIHENEMHVHIVCLSTTAELPFILDELMSIGRKKL
jgi:hypothetical protein